MKLFDTHCHLVDEAFQSDLEEVLARAMAAGVQSMVIPGVDAASSELAVRLAERHPSLFAAVGIHPESALSAGEQEFATVARLALHPKVVAIGEIGLDYHWDTAPRQVQHDVFARQIQLATEMHLPVIVHNRESTADVLNILRRENVGRVGGVMHCFTGSLETAEECIQMGLFLSFGGPVTFKNARNVHAVAAHVPSEWLLVETDSPYLTPHPHRGTRNEPAMVRLVAEQLAQLRGVEVEALAEQTYANALRLFQKAEESSRG